MVFDFWTLEPTGGFVVMKLLFDVDAATKYIQKEMEERAQKHAKEHMDAYNATHKRKIKAPTVEDLKVSFDGFMFNVSYQINGNKDFLSGGFRVGIDDFAEIVD